MAALNFQLLRSGIIVLACIFSNMQLLGQSFLKKESEKPRKFLAIPVLYSSPETSLGAGFTSIYYFRKDTLKETNPTSFRVNAIYTLQNQLLLELPISYFSKGNKLWINSELGYFIYPYEYYGRGPTISLHEFDTYDASFLTFFSDFNFKIKPGLFIGPSLRYTHYNQIAATSQNGIIPNELPGFSVHKITGLGAQVIYDRRNNVFSPSGGYYLFSSLISYHRLTLSDFNFSTFTFDIRKYFQPTPKSELGLQILHQNVLGNQPFYADALLGGSRMMRGYYRGAYRDNVMNAMQMEFRRYVFPRIIGTAFAAMGNVSDQVLDFSSVRTTAGVGVRIEADKKEKIRLRADIAFSKESRGIYLGINEAF